MKKTKSNSDKVAMQFAQALFDMAREKKNMRETLIAAERMAQCFRKSNDLQKFAANPKFDRETVTTVLEALNTHLKLGETIHNCLKLLARTRSLALFPQIADNLQNLDARNRGEVKGRIVSATALTQAEKKSVEQALKSRLGKTPLALSFAEDKSLISGLVFTIQSRMIDLSLRAELRRLKQILYKMEQPI